MNYKLVLENEVPVTSDNLQSLFATKEVFVFGYGSLLYSSGWDRRNMVQIPRRKDLLECEVCGYERGTFGLYSDDDHDIRFHYYGVVPDETKKLNGIITRIHTLRDWGSLMVTECIAGIAKNYTYRCVDVTDRIRGIKLKENQVVHMVTNEHINKERWPLYSPAPGYYTTVAAGVKKERTLDFQREFAVTGGLTKKQAVTLYKAARTFRW